MITAKFQTLLKQSAVFSYLNYLSPYKLKAQRSLYVEFNYGTQGSKKRHFFWTKGNTIGSVLKRLIRRTQSWDSWTNSHQHPGANTACRHSLHESARNDFTNNLQHKTQTDKYQQLISALEALCISRDKDIQKLPMIRRTSSLLQTLRASCEKLHSSH